MIAGTVYEVYAYSVTSDAGRSGRRRFSKPGRGEVGFSPGSRVEQRAS